MFVRMLIVVTPAALACGLIGCQPAAYVAPSPRAEHIATAKTSTVTAFGSGDQLKLLYATTREALGAAGDYGGSVGNGLRLGVATLRVDDDPALGDARALPSLSGVQGPATLSLEKLDERAVFGADASLDDLAAETGSFFSDIDLALSASANKDVFVYVHGGMNSVYRSAVQAAQYRQFSDGDAVVVAFVWPTADYYPNYVGDVGNARQSVPAFRRFVELLARHTRAQHINILAHSAGARIVSSALAALGEGAQGAERETLRARLRLGELYYAAADIEIKDFVQQLKHYADLPLRVTLQANRDDYLLALLGVLPGRSRAGRLNLDELNASERESLRRLASESRLDIIDVTSERGGNIMSRGHAFWFERRWVSNDVRLEFSYHAPPQARGLQATNDDGVKRWVFPSDYEERAAAALLHLPRL